jgi:hypothetical protein
MKQRQIDDDTAEELSAEQRAPMRTGIRLSAYPEPEADMPESAAKPRVPRNIRRRQHR